MRKLLGALHRVLEMAAGRPRRRAHRAGEPADLLAPDGADPDLPVDRGAGSLLLRLDDHDRRDAGGAREGSHFEVDLLPKLSARANAWFAIVTSVFMLLFALLFIHYGWLFTLFGKDQTSEIAELPMWMIFLAWPLAGVTWAAFHGEKLYDAVRALRGRAEA